MKKLLLTLLLVLNLCKETKAQTWVIIPDYNFRSYLNSIVPSAMAGSSLNITSTLVTIGTQSINCNSYVISNLTGIQYFTSLTYLNCAANALTSLPPLPNSLIHLNCGANQLTSLPALPNSIQYLHCEYNPVGTLPALPNSLVLLHCEYNGLSSLPNLPNSLDSVYCFNNNLITLPTLPNSLKYLDCNSNYINSLPSLPNSLTYLDCFNNHIKCFPFFPSSVTQVTLNGNPFNCLPNYVLPAMNDYTNTPLCIAGNTNGCTFVGAGIFESNSNPEFISVFPNPAINILNVKLTDGRSVEGYSVLDAIGRKVLEQNENITKVNVEGLKPGVYQLQIQTEKSSIHCRFVKE